MPRRRCLPQGFTAAENALEGFDGWAQAVSSRHNWAEVTEGLGTRYEPALNTDAAIQLRNESNLQPADIKSVALKVHPLVLNLIGKTEPHAGLDGKFSIYHATAVALVTGRAGEQAFTDRAVNDPVVVGLRDKVTATIDPAIKSDQVDMTITLADGRTLHKFIEHAVGQPEQSNAGRAAGGEFHRLTEDILPAAQNRSLMDLCWKAWDLDDAGKIGRAGAAT